MTKTTIVRSAVKIVLRFFLNRKRALAKWESGGRRAVTGRVVRAWSDTDGPLAERRPHEAFFADVLARGGQHLSDLAAIENDHPMA